MGLSFEVVTHDLFQLLHPRRTVRRPHNGRHRVRHSRTALLATVTRTAPRRLGSDPEDCVLSFLVGRCRWNILDFTVSSRMIIAPLTLSTQVCRLLA